MTPNNEDKIIIKGARLHNLKELSLELPKNKIVVFTGLSGSGKSSLAFDTIFAEGQRRYIESLSPYIRQFLGQMDRPDVDEIRGLSPAIAINQKALSHNPRSTVGTLTEIWDYLRVIYARLGKVYCPKCGDLIEKMSVDEIIDQIQAQAKKYKTNYIGVLAPLVRGRKGEYYQMLYDYLNQGYEEVRVNGKIRSLHNKIELARHKKHNIDLVIDKVVLSDITRLTEAVESALDLGRGLVQILFGKEERDELYSSKLSCAKDGFSYGEIEPRLFSFNSPFGACPDCDGLGRTDWFKNKICSTCQGQRLKPEALSIKINGKNLAQLADLSLDQAEEFFKKYHTKLTPAQEKIAANPLREIEERLQFLNAVGLDYLTLSRPAETLSGGEAQRIRLASQIGSQLSNALYVLDEPTIGLHERDTDRLVATLKKLKDNHNTLIIVEHDELTIKNADHLVDLGPLAGEHGGEIVAQGDLPELIKNGKKFPKSLTLKYLSGQEEIQVPDKRRHQNHGLLKLRGAKKHNLQNINVDLPLGRLVCITGVSGSGKSTLMHDVLYHNFTRLKNHAKAKPEFLKELTGIEYLARAVMVDQGPIGRTPRSNPATYTGIFTPIREFFAELPAARSRAYTPSRFSFNRPDGRCEACSGAGFNLIEMHFLPPVWVECPVCHGARFNRETLQVKYKGKNIAQVLQMPVDEALIHFSEIPIIADKLRVLKEVGLGYIRLGQSATTLSGGEAQRIKLAKELTQPLGKRVLYLLDEPTVGLHYQDVKMLLEVLEKLVARGHTVVVIEHNLHFLKSADYIIDLGPEGGSRGGRLVASGTPEEILSAKNSYTALYLDEYL